MKILREPKKHLFEVELYDIEKPDMIIAKDEAEIIRFYANFHFYTGKKVRAITLVEKR